MRNYVIGTSDHTGRHLNMVQAENVQAALEMCGVLDLGKIPRRDMETHADVDYIYVEEPAGAVVDPVVTRGTTLEQKPVTVLHNFADRFVASQKPLPPEDYAILEQAVQEEFDHCNPPTEAPSEIRTVGDLKAIIAGLPDNYAVTLGSDSVAVSSHGTYDHGAYEVNTFISRITTLHVNPDRRELYVGVLYPQQPEGIAHGLREESNRGTGEPGRPVQRTPTAPAQLLHGAWHRAQAEGRGRTRRHRCGLPGRSNEEGNGNGNRHRKGVSRWK